MLSSFGAIEFENSYTRRLRYSKRSRVLELFFSEPHNYNQHTD